MAKLKFRVSVCICHLAPRATCTPRPSGCCRTFHSMPRFPMQARGSGALPRHLARAKGWARVFGFISREAGLADFLGGLEQLSSTVDKAFGNESDGLVRKSHVLAVDSAHSVRCALRANLGELERLRMVHGHLSNLHRVSTDASALTSTIPEHAVLRKCSELLPPILDLAFGAFICAQVFCAERGNERTGAFVLLVGKAGKRNHAPKSFLELLEEVKAHAKKGVDPSKVELVMNKLDELAATRTAKDALKAVEDFLDDLKLDHTWHEEVDMIQRDYNSGVLVCYETLRRRGVELMKSGHWVRKEPNHKVKDESKMKAEETKGGGRLRKAQNQPNNQRRNAREEIAHRTRRNKPPTRSVQESDETQEPKETQDVVEEPESPKKIPDGAPKDKQQTEIESAEDALEMARRLMQTADEEIPPSKGDDDPRENNDENESDEMNNAVYVKSIANGDATTENDEIMENEAKNVNEMGNRDEADGVDEKQAEDEEDDMSDEKMEDVHEDMDEEQVKDETSDTNGLKTKDTDEEGENGNEWDDVDEEDTELNGVNGNGTSKRKTTDDASESMEENKSRQKRKEEIGGGSKRSIRSNKKARRKPARKPTRRNEVVDLDRGEDDATEGKNKVSKRRSSRQYDVDMVEEVNDKSDAESTGSVEVQEVRGRDDSSDAIPFRKQRNVSSSRRGRLGRRNRDSDSVGNPTGRARAPAQAPVEAVTDEVLIISDAEDEYIGRRRGKKKSANQRDINEEEEEDDDIPRRRPSTPSEIRRLMEARKRGGLTRRRQSVVEGADSRTTSRNSGTVSRNGASSTRREGRLSRRKSRNSSTIAKESRSRKRTVATPAPAATEQMLQDMHTKRRRYSLTKSEREKLNSTQLAFVERYQFEQTQEISVTSLLEK